MKTSYRWAANLLMALLLAGCASTQPKSQVIKSSQEDYFLNVPKDTAQHYYAAGQGEDIESAKSKALADISGRISVSVSSSLRNQQTLNRVNDEQTITEKTDSRVQAITKAIDFSDVKIERSGRCGQQYCVMVSVNRPLLLKKQMQKFKTQDQELAQEIGIFDRSEIFYRLKLSGTIKEKVTKCKELLSLVSSIQAGFNSTPYLAKYAEYENSLRELVQNTIVSIQHDSNSASLATLIKDSLSRENIRISDSGQGNVLLKISTQVEPYTFKSANAKIKALTMVTRTSTMKVTSSAGVVVSNNVVKTKGVSKDGESEAVQQTKPYELMIKKEGILGFISGNS